MPNIPLPENLPGIVGLFAYRPETARPMQELAQTILRGPSDLTPGERELIAAYVSYRNECRFCTRSHSAAAYQLLGWDREKLENALDNIDIAPISEKMRALLAIAAKVQRDGRSVTPGDVALAKEHGASDQQIHDTVLVAAAFSMYNRYVDGLGAHTPDDPDAYDAMGRVLVDEGYVR